MKREFKKGDRVLVRNNDLQWWREATFQEVLSRNVVAPFLATMGEDLGEWTQCRHIDNFCTGDLVQVRDSDTEEWRDSVYVCSNNNPERPHLAYIEFLGALSYVQCRWHPSMPWAEKEELTLEQRVEALERKLNEK